MTKLTDTQVRRAKPADKPYKLMDGRGLFCEVRPTGAKIWRYRYYIKSRSSHYTIGEYPAVTLADARGERDRLKQLARDGIDPNRHRERQALDAAGSAAQTFEVVAREYHAKKVDTWSDYYQSQWIKTMERDAFPLLGGRPIRDIAPHEVLALVRSIENRGALSVANLARMWVGQVCRYAIVTLRADIDPTAPIKGAVRKRPVRHNPGVDADQIAQLCRDLDGFAGYRTTVIAAWLLLYCFPRTVEVRKATWDEIDFEGRQWVLKPERMKARRGHVVPLSDQVVDLLDELHQYTGGQRWLFPNLRRPTECMSATTINRALERMGWKGQLSGHGFRTTASTLLHSMGADTEIIERQLAHAEKNQTKAAYNHAEYLPERRQLLQTWADYIDHLRGRFCLLVDPFPDRALAPAGRKPKFHGGGKIARLNPRINPGAAKSNDIDHAGQGQKAVVTHIKSRYKKG